MKMKRYRVRWGSRTAEFDAWSKADALSKFNERYLAGALSSDSLRLYEACVTEIHSPAGIARKGWQAKRRVQLIESAEADFAAAEKIGDIGGDGTPAIPLAPLGAVAADSEDTSDDGNAAMKAIADLLRDYEGTLAEYLPPEVLEALAAFAGATQESIRNTRSRKFAESLR
jgi:hypothetical protein